MSYLFSNAKRFRTWRELWLSLAIAEKELGLVIPDEAITQMKQNLVSYLLLKSSAPKLKLKKIIPSLDRLFFFLNS